MAEILNEEVRKKLEEMGIDKPADVSGEKPTGDLLLYLSKTLSNPYIMGFLKETGGCLHAGYEDCGGGHESVLKLKSDGFYIASYKQSSGQRGDDEEILVREIPSKFPNLTAEEYKSKLNKSLESAIQSSKEKYKRLGKLFKKEQKWKKK